MRGPDLLADLAAGAVVLDELLDLVAGYFGSGQQDPDGWIRYPADGPVAVRAFARADGELQLERGPALTRDRVDDLRSRIETNLLASTGPASVTRAMFTGRRVEGYYEPPNEAFRVGPVPPTAPRPPQLMADHPFVFEARVAGSADFMVTGYRASREAQRWAWVLNALLLDGVRLQSNILQGHWVLSGAPGAALSERRIEWAQDMYWFDGLGAPGYVLPQEGPEIRRADVGEYYSRQGNDGSTLDVPSSLDASIEAYLALTAADRGRFLRAAQWFAAAREVAVAHRSSMFVALVAAIETLAFDQGRVAVPCPKCGRDVSSGPTGRFKDFLVEMAPGVPRAAADRLYGIRSRLVHGFETLQQDEPLAVTFKSSLLAEQEQTYMLHTLVRSALINWLNAAGAKSGE